jgi:beta-ribofuranosylaminobenzene 5'-phosphate synthase
MQRTGIHMADIGMQLQGIEERVGRLSPVQKILLGTEGSVTQLLEGITGSPVSITTRIQEIVPADPGMAEHLDVRPGDEVNHRVVEIRNARTREVLIYATSYTPLSRLSPEFRDDLMKADIPIGKIIHEHRIESRREILHARVTPPGPEATEAFRMFRNEPLLSREYRIIHQGKPLIRIEEQFPYHHFLDERRVIVETPSRIHLGLIDMNGSIGRVDGGIGIALDGPLTLLEARAADTLEVTGGDEESRGVVSSVAGTVLEALRLGGKASFTLRSVCPRHAGLGSGTQLALATARAVCELYGRTFPVQDLARLTGRGGTSGIGTAAFADGGFIIDGGHAFGTGKEKTSFAPSRASAGVRPAPVIARHEFPPDWKILLAIPRQPAGANSALETDIFRTCCPVPLDEVREICHQVVMRMLPGLAGHDLDLFSEGANRIQELGFKKVEISLRPPEFPALLAEMRNAGAACAGMSSFGPALYAISDTGLSGIERAAREFMDERGGGRTILTSARNCGALVRTVGAS